MTIRFGVALIALLVGTTAVALSWDKYATTDPGIALRGFVLTILGLVPAVHYFTRSTAGRPVMPLMALNTLFYSLSFGYAAFFTGSMSGFAVSEDSIVTALDLTIIGVGIQLVCYYVTFGATKWLPIVRFDSGVSQSTVSVWAWALVAARLAAIAVPEVQRIPTAGQILEMTSLLGIGVLYAQHLVGVLPRWQTLVMLVGVFPVEIVVRLASGSIAQVMMLGLVMILVRWATSRSITWVGLAIAVGSFVIFNPVKAEYRKAYWFEQSAVQSTALDRATEFTRLASDHWLGGGYERVPGDFSSDNSRTNHLIELVVVTDMTPSVVPYWGGSSLYSVFTVLIPRAIWPNKPKMSIGNDFGHTYGILGFNDYTTSVNVPWIVELYCNFGPGGVILGMAAIGTMLALLERKFARPGQSVLNTVIPIAALAGLCAPESNLALLWGGVICGLTAMYLASRFLTLTGDARRRG